MVTRRTNYGSRITDGICDPGGIRTQDPSIGNVRCLKGSGDGSLIRKFVQNVEPVHKVKKFNSRYSI